MNKLFILKNILIAGVILFIGVNLVSAQNQSTPEPVLQPVEIPANTQNKSLPPINKQSKKTKKQQKNQSQSSSNTNNQYQQAPPNNSGYKCTTGNCPPPPQINSWNQQGPQNYQNRPIPNYQNQPPGFQGPPNQQPYYGNPAPQAPPPAISEGPQNVLIILDSSYSMEEKIAGERKIDVAKRVVRNTLKQISPDIRVGLRVYGHKIGMMGIYPCRKTELLVPIAFNTTNEIIRRLGGIQPTGQTPIAYTLITAANNDFVGINGPKRIVLVSDGMETCDGDPCKTAVDMVRQGVDLKIDVVGFDLKDPAAINQLKCIALSTEGKFYTADTEAALAKGLRNSFQFKKNVEGMIIFNK